MPDGMQVDAGAVHELADTLAAAAAAVARLQVSAATGPAAAALPSSATAAALTDLGAGADAYARTIADSLDGLAGIARTTATAYQQAEESFTRSLQAPS